VNYNPFPKALWSKLTSVEKKAAILLSSLIILGIACKIWHLGI